MGQSRWIDDDQIRRKRTSSFPCHESVVPRNAQKQKKVENYQYTSALMGEPLKLFFAQLFLLISSVSTEQSQICVLNTESVKQARGDLLWQDNLTPLFEPASSLMKTPTPLTDDLVQEDLLPKCQERVERLSQQNRVIKICTDAGFLTTVEVGQHFMTKDTEEFSQFTKSVANREYTLPRDEQSSDPKGWIRGNTKIGPVLEDTTSYYCKVNTEWTIELTLQTKTILTLKSEFLMAWMSWSRTSATRRTTTTIRKPLKRRRKYLRWRRKLFAFASRSKAKAKPRRHSTTCSFSRIVPILERIWIDIEPGVQVDQAYPVAKRLNNLLRHGELLREEDGAIEF